MKLVCGTAYWLSKYEELARERKLEFMPWLSRNSILVAEGDDLVCGVMVYDTTGPMVILEHFITNPSLPLSVRWAGSDLLAQEIMPLCRHLNKVPVIGVLHKGVARILKRYGFRSPNTYTLTCSFPELDSHVDSKNPSAHPRSYSHHAPTEPSPPGDSADDLGVYAQVLGGTVG